MLQRCNGGENKKNKVRKPLHQYFVEGEHVFDKLIRSYLVIVFGCANQLETNIPETRSTMIAFGGCRTLDYFSMQISSCGNLKNLEDHSTR